MILILLHIYLIQFCKINTVILWIYEKISMHVLCWVIYTHSNEINVNHPTLTIRWRAITSITISFLLFVLFAIIAISFPSTSTTTIAVTPPSPQLKILMFEHKRQHQRDPTQTLELLKFFIDLNYYKFSFFINEKKEFSL